MMKEKRSIFWGILILVVGTLFLGNTAEWWNVDIFFDGWWTLFILVPSLLGLFKKGMIVTSVLGLTIGGLLLFASLDLITWTKVAKMIFPIILMVVGLTFIFKPVFFNKKIRKKFEKTSNKEFIGIFSSSEEKITKEFFGGTCTAIFGGITLDLRDATIKTDTVIDCVCAFGGVDVKVPDGVNVVTNGIPIFGGVENKSKSKSEDKDPTIIINYICVFSGIEIK